MPNGDRKEREIYMLHKYKEAFGLRDEIGTCPIIEVEINVTDRSSFFIRPYHEKDGDKTLIDKEMKHLCYLVLCNILLPINHHIGNITTQHHSRSMSDNRDLTETFHQKVSSLPKVIASASRYFQFS